MRVLLLHEFSGVHTELQKGLRALGVEALTANFGDSFRGFPTDIRLGTLDASLLGTLGRAATQLSLAPRFRGFDVIQSITASVFNPLVSRALERLVLRRAGGRFVYLAASGDTVYRRQVRSFPYHPTLDWYERPRQGAREARILDAATDIVAGAWDYMEAYRREGYRPTFIPFPVMTSEIRAREVARGPRLRVLHPLNRAAGDDYKGTSHIRAAFQQLEARFGGDVEFIAAGGLPFQQYMELAESCDVLVDQAYTLSYGMSAIYALAQGKVVLSGREELTAESEVYRNSPVVNIRPDAGQIASVLEPLLASRQTLQELGARSRQFAERYHDAVVVAGQYTRIYSGQAPGPATAG